MIRGRTVSFLGIHKSDLVCSVYVGKGRLSLNYNSRHFKHKKCKQRKMLLGV